MSIGLNKTLDGTWEVARESLRSDLVTIETILNQLKVTNGKITAASGGTGLSSFVIGDLLYANSVTTLARLADVATGNALISGGVGVAPAWGKIGLTTHVSGVLPEANGGTNQSTYTLGDLLYASAANTLSKLTGNTVATRKFLRQTGTGAASAAPVWDTLLAADVPASALTKTDDTNVTLTLGGTPASSLLAAVSLTLGWTGTLALGRGGTGADLSATGGTSQVLKQSSLGGAITVGTLASSNLSDASNLPLLNANNHFTGTGDQVFDGTLRAALTQEFSWNTKLRDTIYQAASDGLIVGAVNAGAAGDGVSIYSDASNPPTTLRTGVQGDSGSNYPHPYFCPVRKGDFYKIVSVGISYSDFAGPFWVPLGTAG